MTERGMTRRQFLRLTARMAGGVAVAGLGSLDYVRSIEPGWVDVEAVRFTLPRLAAAFNGYRVVQISDFHLGDWLNGAQLAQVVARVNALTPDLIAVTGDFVTRWPQAVAADLHAGLSALRARDGVLAVLGNHDHSSDPATVRTIVRGAGLTLLENEVYTVERGGMPLHWGGVDDVWLGQPHLKRVVAALPARGAAILLAHEPDFANTAAATGRFDLQLSGHSHGGQVRLPFRGPLRLPPWGMQYAMGAYQVGTMIQYTNRGIGMVQPHLRFNCRPEITLLTLAAPA